MAAHNLKSLLLVTLVCIGADGYGCSPLEAASTPDGCVKNCSSKQVLASDEKQLAGSPAPVAVKNPKPDPFPVLMEEILRLTMELIPSEQYVPHLTKRTNSAKRREITTPSWRKQSESDGGANMTIERENGKPMEVLPMPITAPSSTLINSQLKSKQDGQHEATVSGRIASSTTPPPLPPLPSINVQQQLTICDKSLGAATLGYKLLCRGNQLAPGNQRAKAKAKAKEHQKMNAERLAWLTSTPVTLVDVAQVEPLQHQSQPDGGEIMEGHELARLQRLLDRLQRRGNFLYNDAAPWTS